MNSATLEVKVIPVLENNYVYLVMVEHTQEAVPVDTAMPTVRVRASCGPR